MHFNAYTLSMLKSSAEFHLVKALSNILLAPFYWIESFVQNVAILSWTNVLYVLWKVTVGLEVHKMTVRIIIFPVGLFVLIFSLLGVKRSPLQAGTAVIYWWLCRKDWQSHKAINCSLELAEVASSCLSQFKHQWSRWQQSQINPCKCLLASLSQRNLRSTYCFLF